MCATERQKREACGSICRALLKVVVMKQALIDTQQTDIDEARQRLFIGQAWVFNRQIVSNRSRQRDIIQVHEQ